MRFSLGKLLSSEPWTDFMAAVLVIVLHEPDFSNQHPKTVGDYSSQHVNDFKIHNSVIFTHGLFIYLNSYKKLLKVVGRLLSALATLNQDS